MEESGCLSLRTIYYSHNSAIPGEGGRCVSKQPLLEFHIQTKFTEQSYVLASVASLMLITVSTRSISAPYWLAVKAPLLPMRAQFLGKKERWVRQEREKRVMLFGVASTSTIFIFTLQGSKHGISPQQLGTWRRSEMDQHTQTEMTQIIGFSINISSSLYIAA
jgi:hypothetical protein